MSQIIQPPFNAFRFSVTLTITPPLAGVTNPVCDAAFAECKGLEMSMDLKTVQEGAGNLQQIHLVNPVKYGTLTLTRGMTANLHLWNWFSGAAAAGRSAVAQGQITMLDTQGKPAITFLVQECLPVKITGPSLNGKDGQIAIEEMQLAYTGLRVATNTPAVVSSPNQVGSSGASVSGGPDLEASTSGSGSPLGSSLAQTRALLTIWDIGKNQAIGKAIAVDFNPQNLKVQYSSEKAANNANSNASYQLTKFNKSLTLNLLFDTSREQGDQDVRKKTLKFIKLLNPEKDKVLPGLHFQFGTFIFIGFVTDISETLEYFSTQGTPLRSELNLTLQGTNTAQTAKLSGNNTDSVPGTKSLRITQQGDTLQKMFGANWKAAGERNNIEDPRNPKVGTPLETS